MESLKSLKLKRKFTSVFLNDNFKSIDLAVNRKNLHFGILKLNSNNFDYNLLKDFLIEAAIYYALPKDRVEELYLNREIMKLRSEAVLKFRKSDCNDGEGGELISYCLNEDILNAPKLLSKMKLKTNKNDYVKGADGVHLLKIKDNSYEIIYSESKMYAKLSDGLNEAFKSMDRFINGEFEDFEITTLATNLKGEFDAASVDFISKYIIPSKGSVERNTAFSIFVGFEIPKNIVDPTLNYEKYKLELNSAVSAEIEKIVPSLNERLSDIERSRYSFYIYLIPFFNIEKIRKEIIKDIEGRDVDDK